MNFNYDPMKQTQEIIFSRKTRKKNHPNLFFNESPVIKVACSEHFGIFFDTQ